LSDGQIEFFDRGKLSFDALKDSALDAADAILNKLVNDALLSLIETIAQIDFNGDGQTGGIGFLGKLLGFADGGRPPVGVPSVVGEKGPELFVPKAPGEIFNKKQLGAMGGQTIVQNINIHYDAQLESMDARIRQSAPKIAKAAAAGVRDANQRTGRDFLA
jgi:hypothetical protein